VLLHYDYRQRDGDREVERNIEPETQQGTKHRHKGGRERDKEGEKEKKNERDRERHFTCFLLEGFREELDNDVIEVSAPYVPVAHCG
jgi:hypothetical protein